MNTVFYELPTEDRSLSVSLFIGPVCDHPYPPHVHDVVEVVCLLAGSMEMTIAGQTLRLAPGDIALAFPSTPHSYDAVSEDADGVAMVFSPGIIQEFTHSFRAMQPVHPYLAAADQPTELDFIIRKMQELSQQDGISPLRFGYLHLFLAYLFQVLPLQPLKRTMDSSIAAQALVYISEHFTEPVSLESTAHALGISSIHLSHVFSQQLHVRFRSYVNLLRSDHACMLLRDPALSIVEIAYMCGYGNIRTFNRAFKEHCHLTPCEFRAGL